MEELKLIQAEWNAYNGIIIKFIGINNKYLFSMNSSWKEFLIIELFFIEFVIFDKTH
jgi:hypothetical protein